MLSWVRLPKMRALHQCLNKCICPPETSIVESAFRANKNNVPQSAPALSSIIVTFENEQFDFGDEYDNKTTFIPKQDGVYSIVSTVFFLPNDFTVSYSYEFALLVNGVRIAAEVKTVPRNGSNATVSTIYGLNAGDIVNVRYVSTTRGEITQNEELVHFAASRFPFLSSVPHATPPALSTATSLITNIGNVIS